MYKCTYASQESKQLCRNYLCSSLNLNMSSLICPLSVFTQRCYDCTHGLIMENGMAAVNRQWHPHACTCKDFPHDNCCVLHCRNDAFLESLQSKRIMPSLLYSMKPCNASYLTVLIQVMCTVISCIPVLHSAINTMWYI